MGVGTRLGSGVGSGAGEASQTPQPIITKEIQTITTS